MTPPKAGPRCNYRPFVNVYGAGLRAYRLDKDKINWFLGFVEGRTRVNLPKWWEEGIVNSRAAHKRDKIHFGKLAKDPYHYLAGLKFVKAPHDMTVKKDGYSYVLKIGKDSITLPEEILQNANLHGGCFSGNFTSKHCFVAMHDDRGYPHNVACIAGPALILVEMRKMGQDIYFLL